MDRTERINEARRRQAARGLLRWLLEDFCSRHLPTLRPGELADLSDDVLGFAGAHFHGLADHPLTEEEISSIQRDTLHGLRMLFSPGGWVVGTYTTVRVQVEPGPTAKKPRRAVVEGRLTRLPLPLRMTYVLPKAEDIGELFQREASTVIVEESDRIGRCAQCDRFFYLTRRQLFCSPRCKQLAMDERKRVRRGLAPVVGIEPLPGHEPFLGLGGEAASAGPRSRKARRPPPKAKRARKGKRSRPSARVSRA
jgi:hypothetical protein